MNKKNYILKIQILNDWAIPSPSPKSQSMVFFHHTLTNWILGSYRAVVTLTPRQLFNHWFLWNGGFPHTLNCSFIDNSIIIKIPTEQLLPSHPDNSLISHRTTVAIFTDNCLIIVSYRLAASVIFWAIALIDNSFNYLLIPTENMFLLSHLFRKCLHSVYDKGEIDKLIKRWPFHAFSVLLSMTW